jgi:hypothetical protein
VSDRGHSCAPVYASRDRSAEATGNVTAIVKGIAGETRAVLGAMESAMREVKGGRRAER